MNASPVPPLLHFDGHRQPEADSAGTGNGKTPSDGFSLVLAILLTEEDWKI